MGLDIFFTSYAYSGPQISAWIVSAQVVDRKSVLRKRAVGWDTGKGDIIPQTLVWPWIIIYLLSYLLGHAVFSLEGMAWLLPGKLYSSQHGLVLMRSFNIKSIRYQIISKSLIQIKKKNTLQHSEHVKAQFQRKWVLSTLLFHVPARGNPLVIASCLT